MSINGNIIEENRAEWEAKAVAAGSRVREWRDTEELLDYILEIMSNCSPGVDLLSGEPRSALLLGFPGLPSELDELLRRRLGSAGLIVSRGLREYPGGLDVGLAFAEVALADTGACLIAAHDEDARLATMLPEISLLLLPDDAFLPGLSEAVFLFRLGLAPNPANLCLITGPSRTADIERVLTLGAHGPVELYILVGPANIFARWHGEATVNFTSN